MSKSMSIQTVEWSHLKHLFLRGIKGESLKKEFRLQWNATQLEKLAVLALGSERWYGFTVGQLERWLTEGFHADAISGMSEFNPPVRDKRKLRYSEEGDEFHYDLAASGDENYMSQWTKRPNIPGISIEAEIGFAASTPAQVVNAYNAWLCKVVFSLESAGVDCEILLNLTCDSRSGGNVFADRREDHGQTRIIVKRENEASDFNAFSAMLSPAAVRALGFGAQCLHADAAKRRVSRTHGYWGGMDRDWNVIWDGTNQKLRFTCLTKDAREFPEETMNRKFREALKEIMKTT